MAKSLPFAFFHGERFMGNEPQEITATGYNENAANFNYGIRQEQCWCNYYVNDQVIFKYSCVIL